MEVVGAESCLCHSTQPAFPAQSGRRGPGARSLSLPSVSERETEERANEQ